MGANARELQKGTSIRRRTPKNCWRSTSGLFRATWLHPSLARTLSIFSDVSYSMKKFP